VTLRYQKLPSTDPNEIEKMVRLQAVKQIPYPQDELVISYKILKKENDGYSKVMLVVLNKDMLNKYLAPLKINGLEPEFIALSSEAIGEYSVITKAVAAGPTDDVSVLLDIDLFFTELQIHHDGSLIFSRSLGHGLQSIEDKAKIRDWIDEIKLSLNTYEHEEDPKDISEVIVTGGAGKDESDIKEILEKELKLPVKVVPQLVNIKISANAKAKFENSGHPLSFSSVLALASDYKKLQINLLPASIQSIQKKKTKYRNLAKIAILSGCLLLVIVGLFFKKLHDKEVYLKILKQKLQVIAPEADNLDKKSKMSRMVVQKLKAEGSCLDIIREVYAVTPSNIYLTQVIFDRGKGVTLKGSSPGMAQVFGYISTLEKSKYFKDVQLRYASKRKTKNSDLTDFEVYSPLESF